jgi:hypothetical protein
MRLLLVLPFVLAPLAIAGEHDHAQSSLGRHEHGAGELDVALEGTTLELELRSPAANLLGFEHSPRSAEERQRLARLQEQLGRPQVLFTLPAAAGCRLASQQLDSPLLADGPAGKSAHDEHDDAHSEIHVRYRFDCSTPEALGGLDAAPLFRAFSAITRLQVQLIGPYGQQGGELRPGKSQLAL